MRQRKKVQALLRTHADTALNLRLAIYPIFGSESSVTHQLTQR
jgi:hypothetical protein